MPHKLSWPRLLSEARPDRPATLQTAPRPTIDEDERTAFERDHDRIVFSAPFRRLARKTQVHPLATNDHIHNRLTHSLEVASVCRGFARRVGKLAREHSDLRGEDESKLGWILQSACLIHDLGNPPFGHAGEEVVCAWTEKHADEMFAEERFENKDELTAARANWLYFEGNAQGFRLASRADNPEAGYLNLTHATLGAAIKYPWTPTDERAAQKKKHNIYTTESAIFTAMANDLGLTLSEGVCRHPLSFLTEAADDICYRIIDLEDAVEMGLQDTESVRQLFRKIAGNYATSSMNLPQMRGYAIKALMDKLWQVFESEFDAIMNGERFEELKSSLDRMTKDQLGEIKAKYDAIFGHSKKVAVELGAYHILGRILKALMKTVHAIHDSDTYKDVPFLSKRCAELCWGRGYAEKHFEKSHTWWLSRMSDFVSGLTDNYATTLSGDIGGHSFFGR